MVKKLISSLIARLFFKGLAIDNADVALRYLAISDLIMKGPVHSPRILEVGSGVKGISPYIPLNVTGADISFNGEIAPNLTPIHLTGSDLPFPSGSYDYVVSVDMLEHVPESERQKAVSEMMRVAARLVILAVPCGELAETHDRRLDELYQRVKGERYHFLQEHVDNGLPKKDELESCINITAQKLGRPIKVRIVGNVSLQVRDFFMRVWIRSKSAKLYVWMSPFLCIFRRFLNSGECYRQIFIIDILPGEKR